MEGVVVEVRTVSPLKNLVKDGTFLISIFECHSVFYMCLIYALILIFYLYLETFLREVGATLMRLINVFRQ